MIVMTGDSDEIVRVVVEEVLLVVQKMRDMVAILIVTKMVVMGRQ